jgi:hypothetical protein
MRRASSLLLIATIAVTATLYPAGAEEEEDIGRGEGYVYKWGELDPIFDFEHEWRPDFEGKLYDKPKTESDIRYYEWDSENKKNVFHEELGEVPNVIFEGFLEKVHVVDGVSIYHIGPIHVGLGKFPEYTSYNYIVSESYIPWFRLNAGEVEGWAMAPPVFDGSTYSAENYRPYLLAFIDDYSPLHEEPRDDSPPLSFRPEGSGEIEYSAPYLGPDTFPDVPKGEIAFIIGRCGDWLCVGFGDMNRGWLRFDESFVSVYRLAYRHKLPVEMFATLAIYLPIEDPIRSIGFVTHAYDGDGERFLADPVVSLTTPKGNVSAPATLTGRDPSGTMSADGFSLYYAELPEEVRREDILKVTFYPGNEPDEACNERYVIEFDPATIWSEGR